METIAPEKMNELVGAARVVRENAHAPYSGFKVGAAALAASGWVYTGCNVENASYGLTICAERSAIARAITSGERQIIAIAIVADSPQPSAPCGACRQVLAEFAGDIPVILENLKGKRVVYSLNELMPHRFELKKL